MSKATDLILYGTQTGTAEDLADELYTDLVDVGLSCRLENMFDVDVSIMEGYERVFVVISTWGAGDPPDDAEDFCEALSKMDEGRLNGVDFAVFGLGDSGYEDFCECGKEMDRELERIGGRRFVKRVDCDVDIAEPFEAWKCEVLSLVQSGVIAI